MRKVTKLEVEEIKSVAVATPSGIPLTNVILLFEIQASKYPDKVVLALTSITF